MVGQTQRHTKPQFLSDPMSDRKKRFSPTLCKRDNPVSMTRRIQNARPCVEKCIFFVPPNEELEGTLHPQKCWCTPKNEGKGYMYPQMKKPVGMLYTFHFKRVSGLVCLMMFYATFNNISVISWRSVLLVEETGVPGEIDWPAVNHWQTLSYNVVSPERDSNLVVIGTDCIGSCKSNYHIVMTTTVSYCIMSQN
jgi:hypothetical protein